MTFMIRWPGHVSCRRLLRWSAAGLLAFTLCGCDKQAPSKPGNPLPPQKPPAPKVEGSGDVAPGVHPAVFRFVQKPGGDTTQVHLIRV